MMSDNNQSHFNLHRDFSNCVGLMGKVNTLHSVSSLRAPQPPGRKRLIYRVKFEVWSLCSWKRSPPDWKGGNRALVGGVPEGIGIVRCWDALSRQAGSSNFGFVDLLSFVWLLSRHHCPGLDCDFSSLKRPRPRWRHSTQNWALFLITGSFS